MRAWAKAGIVPNVIAGEVMPEATSEEVTRIVEAYLREHDMPVAGRRPTAVVCNAAIDWWNALPVGNEGPAT
jgi:hypothetical protein